MVASRRNALAAALVAAAASTGRAAADTDRDEISLAVGEQTTIEAVDVQSFSEGIPGVVDVKLPKDEKQFVIVGLKPGTTSLLLIYKNGDKIQYTIRVTGARSQDGAVSKKENVRLDFYFVELSDTYRHQFGVGWPGTFGGGEAFRANAAIDLTGGGSVLSATAVVANQPLPRLDVLQQTGWVRISRQAVLVTANGNEARYQSGGELNFLVQGSLAAEIRQVSFGSTVRVLPRFDDESGRIELRINADVSELADDRGSGVPGRSVTKLETLVNLDMGQGVMLAGLDAHTEISTKAGLPLLSQLPVLGFLFGTSANVEEKVQNVVFIVPSVVDVVQADARGRIAEALGVFERYDGDLDDVALIGPTPSAGEGASGGPRPRKKRKADR